MELLEGQTLKHRIALGPGACLGQADPRVGASHKKTLLSVPAAAVIAIAVLAYSFRPGWVAAAVAFRLYTTHARRGFQRVTWHGRLAAVLV
jgi:hypothetical protein